VKAAARAAAASAGDGAHAVAGLFSIVIPTLNEGPLLPMTTNSILTSTRYPDFEIIVVDDGSTDGSADLYERYPNERIRLVRTSGCGVARARNLGADHARGEYLVFLDAHCRVSPNWLDEFAALLDDPAVALAGPAFTKLETPHPRGCGMYWADWSLDQHWYEPEDGLSAYEVPLTTGACQAFRRDTFFALGRYDDGCTRWGSEDVEICLRAWLLGGRVAVNPAIEIAHHFRESRNYEVDDVDITFNFLRMVNLHLSAPRVEKVVRTMNGNPFVPIAQRRLEASDVYDRRAALDAVRRYDDDWFFANVNTTLRADT
jgi:glycosyltransferase involved in cell wall biosynthesis